MDYRHAVASSPSASLASRPHPGTLGGLLSSPGQPQECEEVGGGGEKGEPPGRDKGAESERETQRPEEAGKIEKWDQDTGRGRWCLEAGP